MNLWWTQFIHKLRQGQTVFSTISLTVIQPCCEDSKHYKMEAISLQSFKMELLCKMNIYLLIVFGYFCTEAKESASSTKTSWIVYIFILVGFNTTEVYKDFFIYLNAAGLSSWNKVCAQLHTQRNGRGPPKLAQLQHHWHSHFKAVWVLVRWEYNFGLVLC